MVYWWAGLVTLLLVENILFISSFKNSYDIYKKDEKRLVEFDELIKLLIVNLLMVAAIYILLTILLKSLESSFV